MRKKLFAIVMSMTMVASFMPSMAFAAEHSPSYKIDNSCVEWTVSGATATAKLKKIKCAETGCEDTFEVASGLSLDVVATGTADKHTFTATVKGKYNNKTVSGNSVKEITVSDSDHDYEVISAKEATCQEAGYSEHSKCKVCGYEKNKTPKVKQDHFWVLKDDAAITTDNKIAAEAPVECKWCKKTGTVTAKTAVGSADGEATTVKKATCEATGVKSQPMKVTNASIKSGYETITADVHWAVESETPKTTHTVVDGITYVWNHENHTCMAYMNYCANCETYTDSKAATVTEVSVTKPTCTNSGTVKYTAKATFNYSTGSIVGDISTEQNPSGGDTFTVAKLGHKYEKVAEKPATCTEAGHKAYYTCVNENAGDKYAVDEKTGEIKKDEHGALVPAGDVVLPEGHVMVGDWTWTKAGDTYEAKVKNLKCKTCGIVRGGEHDATVTKTVTAATCSKEGLVKYSAVVEGLTYKYDKPADVGSGGTSTPVTEKCIVKEEKEEVIPKLNHTLNYGAPAFDWNAKTYDDVSCTVNLAKCQNYAECGYAAESYNCTVEFEKAPVKTSEMTDAQYEAAVKAFEARNFEPTCTVPGKRTVTAKYVSEIGKVFTDTKTVVIPSSDHEVVIIDAVAPTVFTVGQTAGAKCSVCGTVLTAPKEVAKLKVGTAKISSLKAGKKSFTVKASAANATGYRVYYKKSGAKKYSYTTVKAKNLSKTVKKLSAGKKYTVKVKAYAKNYDGDGEVVWGALSSGKTVKVK